MSLQDIVNDRELQEKVNDRELQEIVKIRLGLSWLMGYDPLGITGSRRKRLG